jgi:hypothetical protein
MQVWLGQVAPPSSDVPPSSVPPSSVPPSAVPPSAGVHALLSLQVVPSTWLLQVVACDGLHIWHESVGLLAPLA